ncbi:MAG TPA: multidrug efflux RND transporter permease subunit [Candidatus Dormibacteraeota bacterium]|nr:multidrug efflux RND transporter permease subunit [Candidatus Dormibacteraeota bacterium]
MSAFFIRRPIFAAVCSLIILIAGLIVIPTLPIAQYPQIAPPVVTVSAEYIGANAQTVEATVTTPLEQAINGVQGLRYISSRSGNDGSSTITCTFDLSRSLDQDATDVQNAVQSASGLLPAAVKQTGITVSKNSGSFVMAMALKSDDPRYGKLYLSNYAELNVVNALKRVRGVSDVRIFGERRYAMRIWIDPRKLAQNGLTAGDVVSALQEQNVQVAAGSIGSAPEAPNQPYTYTVNAVGRLSDPAQFKNIILKTQPDGGYVRLGDVARVDLGAQDYSTDLNFDGNSNLVGLGVIQLPDANALDVSRNVLATMDRLAKSFPPGVSYEDAFNSTAFIHESIREVVTTLVLSIVLVILVIYLFLQTPGSTLIPAVTIPVSLIGAFAIIKLLGFTINTITLFALTLATGLVVDDAIVVVENVARFIQEKHMDRREGATAAMREVQSAVVAASFVLLAVFIPVSFFPGTTGQLDKQFGLTIAAAVTISLFNSLTLTPALSALLLGGERHTHFPIFEWFNRGLAAFRRGYDALLPRFFRLRWLVAVTFLAALGITGYLFRTTPTAFIPNEDQGFFIATIQAPEGTSLSQEIAIGKQIQAMIRKQPEVAHVFDVSGFSFNGAAPNVGIMFVNLKPWSQRRGPEHTLDAVLNRIRGPLFMYPKAQVFAFNPPAIPGVGSVGGFQFELEDRGNISLDRLAGVAFQYLAQANRDPNLTSVYTTFRIDSPQLDVQVDRNKAKAIGIGLSDVFGTLEADIGSIYVNDFTYLNRSYRVYVQGDDPYRSRVGDLQDLYVRSASGGIVPLSSLVRTKMVKTAPSITHYNLYRSIEIDGQTAPGHGSGQAIAAMEQLAQKIDPPGVGYEWTGIAQEEIQAGSLALLIFALGGIFAFLVLAAQYESFTDPLIVMLAVPLALLGALLGLGIRHLPSDAYAQIGYVMLIGLASKNAILIVEFANQQVAQGVDLFTAARRGAETRLRPILMTSLAFILAVVPLVFATGAGSAARHSLGTVVFGGMIVSTLLNLIVTPVIYVIVKSLAGRRRAKTTAPGPSA